MSSDFIGHIYPSTKFEWNNDRRLFNADIVDVPAVLRHMSREDFSIGFGIKSVKTQRVIYFNLVETVIDSQTEDVDVWVFDVTDEYKCGPLADIKVVVSNNYGGA